MRLTGWTKAFGVCDGGYSLIKGNEFTLSFLCKITQTNSFIMWGFVTFPKLHIAFLYFAF